MSWRAVEYYNTLPKENIPDLLFFLVGQKEQVFQGFLILVLESHVVEAHAIYRPCSVVYYLFSTKSHHQQNKKLTTSNFQAYVFTFASVFAMQLWPLASINSHTLLDFQDHHMTRT